jgi:DNA repair protein RecO (recombination protein O)
VTVRRAEAFVLRTQTLGESDVLLSLLTRDEGKLRGVARAARRSRRRFGGALEPLTRVRVTFRETEGRDLARIDDLEIVHSFFAMQAEPRVAAACAYAAELAEAFGREKEPDPRFFRLVGSVLEGLERGVEPLLAVRYLEVWTLKLQGILPDPRVCGACGGALGDGSRVDLRDGELHCRRCAPSGGPRDEAVGAGALELVARILRVALPELASRGPAAADRQALGRLVAALLQRFVERPFRSLRVLEEVSR